MKNSIRIFEFLCSNHVQRISIDDTVLDKQSEISSLSVNPSITLTQNITSFDCIWTFFSVNSSG